MQANKKQRMTNLYSIYGPNSFIGKRFIAKNENRCVLQSRESKTPLGKNIVFFIGTNTNYNIFSDLHVDIQSNLVKTIDILSECKDKDVVFNFISSWFVYAGCQRLPFSENCFGNPMGFYSATKKCAESMVITFCETFGIKYRIIRLSNTYGEGDSNVSSRKNALQFLIGKLAKNEDLDLYYGGDFVRDYVHVDDCCDGIKIVCDNGDLNSIYNVGSGIPYKFIDIINTAKDILNSSSKINSINPTRFHDLVQVKDSYLDISKIKSIGFSPKISIEEGIRRLV